MLKKRFLALICGVIFSFGFAPFDLWLLSVLSVAVLVGSINKSSNKEAFLVGYAFGSVSYTHLTLPTILLV